MIRVKPPRLLYFYHRVLMVVKMLLSRRHPLRNVWFAWCWLEPPAINQWRVTHDPKYQHLLARLQEFKDGAK